jgi:glycosyltransferase involved in cell wall biosynthesis
MSSFGKARDDMNKLVFDLTVCQPIKSTVNHGGGVYGYIVFKELVKSYGEQVLAYVNSKRYVPDDVLETIRNNNVQVVDANAETLVSVFTSRRGDRLYSPLYNKSYELLYPLNIPITVTIHGLRALEMNRDGFEYKYANSFVDKVKALVKQTPYYNHLEKQYYGQYSSLLKYPYVKVITVSEHSKNSLLCYYPFLRKELISVRYSPSTTNVFNNHDLSSRRKDHYLIISANRWLKNSYRAILALDYLYSNNMIERPTVILGIKEGSTLLGKVVNKDKFICKGYVSESELEENYYSAFALLYPTLNEGFGYPPLEAMKFGVPVVASSFASIQEVCGDAVLFTNPYSYMEIANRILQLNDEAVYERYEKEGLERYNMVLKKQNDDLLCLVQDIINK